MAELSLQAIPLKTSSDVDVVKPLKNVIQSAEDTEDFTDALNELSRLRESAIWKVSDKSSLEVIYSYYDQLTSLIAKIPAQEVQIPFKWKDAFDRGSIFGGRRSLTLCSLEFERVCVLFNMAAMQSAVAAGTSLSTDSAQQQTAKLLQQSAGILQTLHHTVLSAVHTQPTPDLQPDALHALHRLMLAQAQEVVLYKCVKDEMKDGMVSKVAAHCEELYSDATRALSKEPSRALWEKDLLAAATAKTAIVRGVAQYYGGLSCGAEQLYGEEIARLRLASSLLETVRAKPDMGLYAELRARCERRLAAAVRDNDFIYHDRVPEAQQLSALPRTAVVKPLPMLERWSGSADLFAKLESVASRRSAAAASARRGELAHTHVSSLRAATQALNTALAELRLPLLEEDEGMLPTTLKRQWEAVRERGGVQELRRLKSELPELLVRNREILDETERMLREESQSDESLRTRFGARWTRSPSAVLTDSFRSSLDKYRQVIQNAVQADEVVSRKFEQYEDGILALSGSEDELVSGLPAGEGGHAEEKGAANAVRGLLTEMEKLKTEREALEAELLAPAVVGSDETPESSLAPLSTRVRSSLSEQESLMDRFRAAQSRLPTRTATGREQAVSQLSAAHDAYRELHANLQEGNKFYNDLTHMLLAFQNKVSDYCFARKTEKEELLKDLTQEASRPAPAPPVSEPATSQIENPRPPVPAAPQATLPYPTQPQGMPLPYGTSPYAYYAPPMPAVYNPYATLPYPHHAPRGPPVAPAAHYYHPAGTQYPQQPPGYNPYPQPPH